MASLAVVAGLRQPGQQTLGFFFQLFQAFLDGQQLFRLDGLLQLIQGEVQGRDSAYSSRTVQAVGVLP